VTCCSLYIVVSWSIHPPAAVVSDLVHVVFDQRVWSPWWCSLSNYLQSNLSTCVANGQHEQTLSPRDLCLVTVGVLTTSDDIASLVGMLKKLWLYIRTRFQL
jgi:hypothetical protein